MKNKKVLVGVGVAAVVVVGAAVTLFDQPAPVKAFDGPEAVGIVVKNGSRIGNILATQFVVGQIPCDPLATTTPTEMCKQITYQGRPVTVYYTAPLHIVNTQFSNDLNEFPFDGSVAYVNRSDQEIEPRFIQFMLESGAGTTTILNEF